MPEGKICADCFYSTKISDEEPDKEDNNFRSKKKIVTKISGRQLVEYADETMTAQFFHPLLVKSSDTHCASADKSTGAS